MSRGKVRVTGIIKRASDSLTALRDNHGSLGVALFDGHAVPVAVLEFRSPQAIENWLPKLQAAPELLSALEALTDAAAKCGNLIPWTTYSNARDAIKKAKGL